MKRNRRSGFSLIEVMIVSAILVFVSAALYMMLFGASNTYGNMSSLGDTQERARRVMDEMAKELRMADQATVLPSMTVTTNDTITFRIPDVDPATGKAKFTLVGTPPVATVTWGPDIKYVYEPTVLDPLTKLAINGTIDANNNRVADEGGVLRMEKRVPANLANPWKVTRLCHFVKQNGLKFTKTGDNVVIEMTLISVDNKNKVIETTLRSSVTLRNSSTP